MHKETGLNLCIFLPHGVRGIRVCLGDFRYSPKIYRQKAMSIAELIAVWIFWVRLLTSA